MKRKKRLKKRVKIILFILLLSFIIIILLFLFIPKITLNGPKNMTIAFGNNYEEPGYSAKQFNKDLTNNVKIDNNININKLGTYEVNYSINNITKKRIVNIVDNEKPSITLNGNIITNICPGKEYQEEGYNANDNYDGDITDKVTIKKQDNSLIYQVQDSSGNTTNIERTINNIDEEKPTITLKKGDNITIYVGNKYNEPGYTAIDNCDGDITDKVIVEGNVDTNKNGTYELTYTVNDTANNSTTVKRTIKVVNKPTSNSYCGQAGVIYLTFDDGPSQTYTPIILDKLKEYNVKATFFVTKNGPDNMIKREYDEGHKVALHTYTHSYKDIYASENAYWNDIKLISDRVEKITGEKTYLIRFPGGSSNTVSKFNPGIMSTLAREVNEKGYAYFDWNISSGDAGGTTDPQVECANVTTNLSKSRGNVVLMHDIKKQTSEAISCILKYGIDNGYQFKVLDKNVVCHHGINN